jgi:hypothetical protein
MESSISTSSHLPQRTRETRVDAETFDKFRMSLRNLRALMFSAVKNQFNLLSHAKDRDHWCRAKRTGNC